MIKLYGNPASTCTRKVLCVLAETNTPFEFVMVDFTKGEHKQPAHMAKQPFGRVPAIEDGDFSMFESRAICRYLNRKVGGSLEPADLRGRAVMEQWMSVEQAEFTPPAMKLIYNYVFYPMMGKAQDAAMIADGNSGVTTCLQVMDRQLEKTPFMAGDSFSLADVNFLPYVDYLMAGPGKELFAPHKHVLAWWNRCSERPSWRKAAGR